MQGVKNFLGGMGLGMIANQLADLRLGELLDTPPPGLDEAVAIAKVQLLNAHATMMLQLLLTSAESLHGVHIAADA